MNFEKYFSFLKEKLDEISIDDPQSHTAKGFNMGAETMLNYARIALMEIQTEYHDEKFNNGKVSA